MFLAIVAGQAPNLVTVLGPFRSKETAFRRGDRVLGSRRLVHVVEIAEQVDDTTDDETAELDTVAG